jgi:hypothetical protein
VVGKPRTHKRRENDILFRHCERSEAIQVLGCKGLDCFVAVRPLIDFAAEFGQLVTAVRHIVGRFCMALAVPRWPS